MACAKHHLVRRGLVATMFALLALIPLGSIGVAPAHGYSALDMIGAIQIRDPFGSCHADSYSIMADLGVKNNRKDITWAEVEQGDDNWWWNNWDNRIAGLKAYNQTALPILDYSNWAVQDGGTYGKQGNYINTPHDTQEWLEYANECVERYYEKME